MPIAAAAEAYARNAKRRFLSAKPRRRIKKVKSPLTLPMTGGKIKLSSKEK